MVYLRKPALKVATAAASAAHRATTDEESDRAETAANARASDAEQQLETPTHDQALIFQGLQTVMTFTTFLAGFLLTSLTGVVEAEEASASEAFQIFLQILSFGVRLAATMYAGSLMILIVTSDKYALETVDLPYVIKLSVLGLGLVTLTVAVATFLALGLTTELTTNYVFFFFSCLGLLDPVFSAFRVVRLGIKLHRRCARSTVV